MPNNNPPGDGAAVATDRDALLQENARLRDHVLDLQRRMARYDEGGERRTMSGLDVSISDREELLVEAERIVHMGSWVWDIEGNSVAWSDELYRILGYDPETEPATRERFFAALHPQDRERIMQGSANIVATGQMGEGLFRVVRRDGTTRFVQGNGSVIFDSAGTMKRIVGTILDITERHVAALALERAHRQLQDAQTQARLGSWAYDFNTKERTWSVELFRILGLNGEEPPPRESLLARLHPDDLPAVQALRERVEAHVEAAEPVDLRVVRPDGEVRNVRITYNFDRDSDGNICAVRGIMHDVTDITALQKRLALAERMEMIGRLAGGIAHDFNNIMTVIHGGAELLGTPDHDWDTVDLEIIAQIKTAVASARDLTSRLLAFGRQSTVRLKRVDPNQIVRDTVRLVTRILGEHITVETQLADNAPSAMLDVHLTSQALINLFINARDAMPRGGRIYATTRRVDGPAGPLLEIGVRDTGPGIAANLREKVFEPFFTTKHEGQGTGLGLAMVQGAVEQLGGSITLESGPDGTTFVMRFSAAAHDQVGVTSSDPKESPAKRRLRVLVVEDQESLAIMVQRLLKRAGHEVHISTSPTAAIDHYRSAGRDIDLVLSDVLMPEMSGMELIDRLAAIAPLPRVVFMSGYGAEAVRTLGHDRIVLAKPFTNAELLSAIERAFRD